MARRFIGGGRRMARRLQRRCLVDQHDGNPVTNGITQLAVMTQQGRLRFAILEVLLAFWTHQDREQLRRNGHEDRSSGSWYPSRRSAFVLRRQFGSTLTRRSR